MRFCASQGRRRATRRPPGFFHRDPAPHTEKQSIIIPYRSRRFQKERAGLPVSSSALPGLRTGASKKTVLPPPQNDKKGKPETQSKKSVDRPCGSVIRINVDKTSRPDGWNGKPTRLNGVARKIIIGKTAWLPGGFTDEGSLMGRVLDQHTPCAPCGLSCPTSYCRFIASLPRRADEGVPGPTPL